MKRSPHRRRILLWIGMCLTFLFATVWIGSYWYGFEWASAPLSTAESYYLQVDSGSFGFMRFKWWSIWGDGPIDARKHVSGFYRISKQNQLLSIIAPKRSNLSIAIPLWIPSLLLASTTTFIFLRRTKSGLCANCEYDLREITSERCPECGDFGKLT